MSKKKKHIEERSEFRTGQNKELKGHPAYIYARIGKRFEYIGITHAEITKGLRNIPLEKNPNPTDKKSAYLRPNTAIGRKDDFGAPKKNWKFTTNDKITADNLIAKNRDKKK